MPTVGHVAHPCCGADHFNTSIWMDIKLDSCPASDARCKPQSAEQVAFQISFAE